ncbi:hypothetical protein DY000_02014554 [Brassica cretica]|uniref:Uncharacterized protein n=1 Tax=Brassica cretica TaxID=69181 RepID=A0ABQ7D0C8_BRACR|nr:hypothetical protein DY000_02014554 [Brassica cretica]
MFGPGGHMGTRRSHGNPGVIPYPLNPEIVFGPGGTVLRLPRQEYYRYLLGSSIMPFGSWPLSSSYAACCFCRKPP